MGNQLQGLRLVVSGASGGVGRAILNHFAASAANMVGVDKVAFGPGRIGQLTTLRCDIATRSGVRDARRAITRRVTAIDILVHAIGIFHDDAAVRRRPSTLERLWNTNYAAPSLLSEALLPLLRKGRSPMVVFISSADGVVASAGQDCEIGVSHDGHYAATKGALLTATRCLAMKWAKYGVRANAICPTIIRTPMTAPLLKIRGKEASLVKHLPLGRICEPEDVAVAVECLYRLEMTTAHMLPVDAGYLCR